MMTAFEMFKKDFKEEQESTGEPTIVYNEYGSPEVLVVSPSLLPKLTNAIESKGRRLFMLTDCVAI